MTKSMVKTRISPVINDGRLRKHRDVKVVSLLGEDGSVLFTVTLTQQWLQMSRNIHGRLVPWKAYLTSFKKCEQTTWWTYQRAPSGNLSLEMAIASF